MTPFVRAAAVVMNLIIFGVAAPGADAHEQPLLLAHATGSEPAGESVFPAPTKDQPQVEAAAPADALAPADSAAQNRAAEPAAAPSLMPSAWQVGLALAATLAIEVIRRRRLHRPVAAAGAIDPDAPSIADWPFLIMGAALLWIALAIGAQSARTLFSVPPGLDPTLQDIALLMLGSYAGALMAAVFVFAVLPGMTERVGMARPWASMAADARRGLVAFVLVMPIVLTLGTLANMAWSALTGERTEAIAHDTLRAIVNPAPAASELWRWATILCVTVGAPVVEELIYRGFLQSAIRRAAAGWGSVRAGWMAVGATSLIFTLMHAGVAEPHALVTLLALSIGFGVAFERTRRLLTPIVMHVLFNAANVLLATLAA